jgi:hypothetical protein
VIKTKIFLFVILQAIKMPCKNFDVCFDLMGKGKGIEDGDFEPK